MEGSIFRIKDRHTELSSLEVSSESKNTPKRTVFSWNVALNRTPCDKITPDYTNMPVGIYRDRHMSIRTAFLTLVNFILLG